MNKYKTGLGVGLVALLMISLNLTEKDAQESTVLAKELTPSISVLSQKEIAKPLHQKEPIIETVSFMEKRTAVIDAAKEKKAKEEEALKQTWIAGKQKAEAARLEKERIEEERLLAIAKEQAKVVAAEEERQRQVEAEAQARAEEEAIQTAAAKETEESQEAEQELSVVKETAHTQVEQPKEEVIVEEEPTVHGQTMTVQATAYSTNQPSLGSITATGINLHQNPNVIAVDPSFIPLGSTVHVEGMGTFIAGDTGSDIVGNRIDIHMTNLNQAVDFGRQTLTLTIVQ